MCQLIKGDTALICDECVELSVHLLKDEVIGRILEHLGAKRVAAAIAFAPKLQADVAAAVEQQTAEGAAE